MTTALKALLITVSMLSMIVMHAATPNSVNAAECQQDGQCVDNKYCECVAYSGNTCAAWSHVRPCGSAVVGSVEVPVGVDKFTTNSSIGILSFASRVVQFITITAGLFVMFNFIRAGWMFLAAGDNTKAAGEVKDLLTYSVIGLVIIALTYTIAGLIGLILFNDPGFILNPELYSAIDQTPAP